MESQKKYWYCDQIGTQISTYQGKWVPTLDFALLINDLALAAESVDYSVNTFFGISLGDQIVLTLGIYLQYYSNTFSTLHTDSFGI